MQAKEKKTPTKPLMAPSYLKKLIVPHYWTRASYFHNAGLLASGLWSPCNRGLKTFLFGNSVPKLCCNRLGPPRDILWSTELLCPPSVRIHVTSAMHVTTLTSSPESLCSHILQVPMGHCWMVVLLDTHCYPVISSSSSNRLCLFVLILHSIYVRHDKHNND